MRYVSIEGNIGAGKSAVVDGLSKLLMKERNDTDVNFVRAEPVEHWMKILPLFYENPEKHAFMFQMEILKSRIQQIRNLEKEMGGDRLVVLERCPESGSEVFVPCLFQDGYIAMNEREAYMEWHELTKQLSGNKLEAMIFLDADPQVCIQRIHRRDRNGEQNVSLEYLQKLDSGYRNWIRKCEMKGVPVYVINTNKASISDVTNLVFDCMKKLRG